VTRAEQPAGGPRPAGPAQRGARSRLRAYLMLAKIDVPDYWLAVPIAWSATAPARLLSTVPAATVQTLAIASGYWATVALDDVQGSRDGSDATNYAESTDRPRHRKPVVTGELDVRLARRFAVGTLAVSVLAALAGIALAPYSPWWLFAVALATVALSAQYSAGLKVSYRGPGLSECLLFVSMAVSVLIPAVSLHGGASTLDVAESVVAGLWMVKIAVCSNSHDVAGDAVARRHTTAVTLSAAANRRYVASLFLVEWAGTAAFLVLGWLPWLTIALLAPCYTLQVRQLRLGPVGGDWLAARRLGFLALRVGAAGLIATNLLT